MTDTNPFITQTKTTSEQFDATKLIHRLTSAAVKFLHLSCRAIFEVDGHPTGKDPVGCLPLSQAAAVQMYAAASGYSSSSCSRA